MILYCLLTTILPQDGKTALAVAVSKNAYEMVQMLIEKGGADVNCIRVRIYILNLRWHGSHSAEVNKNINFGYSQDQGYS